MALPPLQDPPLNSSLAWLSSAQRFGGWSAVGTDENDTMYFTAGAGWDFTVDGWVYPVQLSPDGAKIRVTFLDDEVLYQGASPLDFRGLSQQSYSVTLVDSMSLLYVSDNHKTLARFNVHWDEPSRSAKGKPPAADYPQPTVWDLYVTSLAYNYDAAPYNVFGFDASGRLLSIDVNTGNATTIGNHTRSSLAGLSTLSPPEHVVYVGYSTKEAVLAGLHTVNLTDGRTISSCAFNSSTVIVNSLSHLVMDMVYK